jgi:hypothetical protein
MKDYLENLREARQNMIRLATSIAQNPDDADNTRNVASAIQAQMLQLGNELEQRFHLENSRILRLLQTGCELCYVTAVGHMDVPSFCQYISSLLISMEYEYVWSTPENAHELSIAAIIKNENNIIEWIEYHLMVGVQHFYIYDNESTDGLERKLQKYIRDGIVTYIYWQGKQQQLPVYNHAVSHFQYETKYLAIIDGDEYIVPVEEGALVPKLLDEIVAKQQSYRFHIPPAGGVGIQWRIYGTAGHKTRCSGLIFENYRYRAEDDFDRNCHIKTICNPRLVNSVANPHFVKYLSGYFNISEKGSIIPSSFFCDASCQKLRLNHYWIKSEEEFLEKNRRGWPDMDFQLKQAELHEAVVDCSKVYDPIMNRYIDELKKRVAAYEESNR